MAHKRKLYDIMFRTKDDRIVIFQKPNFAVWAMLVFGIAYFLRDNTMWHMWTVGLAAASLMIWSIMELVHGVNLFRRLLGLIGALFALYVLLVSSN